MGIHSTLSAILLAGALLGSDAAVASGDDPPVPVQLAEAEVQQPKGGGNDSDPSGPERSEATETAEVTVVYRPPRRGAPRVNVGAGGVRGVRAAPRPLVLAPDHVGLTTTAAPSLFWYIDGPPEDDLTVVFTLNAEDRIEPLVEAALPAPERAGIQRLRLRDHGVELAPDTDYEWSIALVGDEASEPQLAVSVGYLRRVVRPPELPGASPAAAYAGAGLWYDALASLSDAIAAHPDDATSREQRSSLLRQAGLEAAVD